MASCAAGEEIEETVGSVAEQVDEGLTAVPVANGVACDTDRQTFQLAIEAFTAMTGAPPAAEADLVTQGLLREESARYDLDPAGAIVPAPGSGCS
ncbi:MAG: hypothetical protein ACK5CE_18330 [Actinomycetes bacterium]